VENPWLNYKITSDNPKFHRSDRPNCLAFNQSLPLDSEFRLAEHLEPFPYLGNPEGNVFILLANPGISDKESATNFRMNPAKAELNRGNLIHRDLKSFKTRIQSPSNPQMESDWLKPRVKELVSNTSIDKVVNGLFLANFHAYHSKAWFPIPFTFETQRYTFHLVSKAIERESLIVMGRNLQGWFTAIPGLFDYKYRVNFRSTRSVHISKNNLGLQVFNDLLRYL